MADEPFNYSGKLAYLRRVCVDPRLQRTVVAVAAVLIDYADKNTGRCYPSVARIVQESGVPKTTTLRALRRMEEFGWLITERRNGAQSSYTLTSSDTGTGATVGTGASWNQTGAIQNLRVGRTGPDTGTEAVPTPEPEQENSIKATGEEQGCVSAERFADFWKAYPKKVGKAAASAVWKRKTLDPYAAAILADVSASNAPGGRWCNTARKFIKDPERYLKGEHWNDEWQSVNAIPLTGLLPRDTRSEDEQEAANLASAARFAHRGQA